MTKRIDFLVISIFVFSCIVLTNFAEAEAMGKKIEKDNTKKEKQNKANFGFMPHGVNEKIEEYVKQGVKIKPQLNKLLLNGSDTERLIAYSTYFQLEPEDTKLYVMAVEDSYYVNKILPIIFLRTKIINKEIKDKSKLKRYKRLNEQLLKKIKESDENDSKLYNEALRNLVEKSKYLTDSWGFCIFFEEFYIYFAGQKYNNFLKRDIISSNYNSDIKAILFEIFVRINIEQEPRGLYININTSNEDEVLSFFINKILKNQKVPYNIKIGYTKTLATEKKLKISKLWADEIRKISNNFKDEYLLKALNKLLLKERSK